MLPPLCTYILNVVRGNRTHIKENVLPLLCVCGSKCYVVCNMCVFLFVYLYPL